VQTLATEAAGLEADLARLVTALAPWLLGLPGVGPISAAQVLVSWSYAGRLRSEAAFAALAVPSAAGPQPAGSDATAARQDPVDRRSGSRLNSSSLAVDPG
jgi:transposase